MPFVQQQGISSPRRHCRGRIEALTERYRRGRYSEVLHGVTAVAALKLRWSAWNSGRWPRSRVPSGTWERGPARHADLPRFRQRRGNRAHNGSLRLAPAAPAGGSFLGLHPPGAWRRGVAARAQRIAAKPLAPTPPPRHGLSALAPGGAAHAWTGTGRLRVGSRTAGWSRVPSGTWDRGPAPHTGPTRSMQAHREPLDTVLVQPDLEESPGRVSDKGMGTHGKFDPIVQVGEGFATVSSSLCPVANSGTGTLRCWHRSIAAS